MSWREFVRFVDYDAPRRYLVVVCWRDRKGSRLFDVDRRWFALKVVADRFDRLAKRSEREKLQDFAELMCGPPPWIGTQILTVEGGLSAVEEAVAALVPPSELFSLDRRS